MLRIAVGTGPGDVRRVGLEGRLVGPWTGELERCVGGGDGLLVDCARLTYADQAGVALLARLAAQGARLDACPALLDEQLRAWRRAEAGRLRQATAERLMARAYRVARGIAGEAAVQEQVVRGALAAWLAAGTPDGAEGEAVVDRAAVRAALAGTDDDVPGGPLPLPAFGADGHRLTAAEDGADPRALGEGETIPGSVRAVLEEALGALPARSRAAVLLRDAEGAPLERVAEALGESRTEILARLHRARMALRERLASAAGAR
jgi:RNA polymerase sigma-70 factor (ECF subfamily)